MSNLPLQIRKIIVQEVQKWEREGIISPSQSKAICARYNFDFPKPEPALELPPVPVQPVAAPVATPAAFAVAATPKPAPEPVPFDQWLLSERNIKAALYSGGILLILAGLIFVGVNWTHIPGPGKFAITLMITALMYLGGYLLFRRPALKLGGVALLCVASGFVPLNFVVLHIYIFSAMGLSANSMWLIASLPTLLLYALTAYWTRASVFTFLGIGALASALTAVLVLLHAPWLVFMLAYALLLLALLLVARALQATPLSSFTRFPVLVVSHLVMPFLFFISMIAWISSNGDRRLSLASMFTAVLYYLCADVAFRQLAARWVSALAFVISFAFLLTQLQVSAMATGISLMLLALAYLLVGRFLEQRAGRKSAGMPLYFFGYCAAVYVTFMALLGGINDPDNLAKTLIADVVLLAVSAWVHRQYAWIYGAVWLFIAPVCIYIYLYVGGGMTNQGLVLGVLMLNYVAAGYALGRRAFKLSGPFLTAAAFLGIPVVVLTWTNAIVASVVLALIVTLYVLVALWRKWSWLLLPALFGVNLMVMTVLFIFVKPRWELGNTLTVLYGGLGVVLALGGAGLRRAGQKDWGWPLYLVAAFDLGMSYLVGLFISQPVAIGFSAVFALLLFLLAWVERESSANEVLSAGLTYLGIVLLFAGHFYLIDFLHTAYPANWPAYTAGLCAFFIALAWFLRAPAVGRVYGTPLRVSGMALMLVPLIAALTSAPLAALVFAIAGIVLSADAALRRSLKLAYLGAGMFLGMLWSLLIHFQVREPQAYVMPLGLGLLVAGWVEQRRAGSTRSPWVTILGLFLLMGFSFAQSLGSFVHAVLLLAESIVTLAWGMRTHSRSKVQLGGLALLANAVTQFGPAFVELPRWIQLGAIGTLLMGGGMVALFQREKLLATRERLTNQWKEWQP